MEERTEPYSKGPSDSWSTAGALPALISEAEACTLRPLEFFVAWHGVLTIAYSGFPPALCKLKRGINAIFPSIPKENPGSLWPKTSLACLKDSKFLSMSQLVQLREICRDENLRFSEEDAVFVDKLSVVVYQNCCLEKTLMFTEIPLQRPVNSSEPLLEEGLHIRSVLDEFADDNLCNYYSQVIREGHRTTHYRDPKVGSTIVHFLHQPLQSLARFRERVEAVMPGMYDWFVDDSLHITIRALL